ESVWYWFSCALLHSARQFDRAFGLRNHGSRNPRQKTAEPAAPAWREKDRIGFPALCCLQDKLFRLSLEYEGRGEGWGAIGFTGDDSMEGMGPLKSIIQEFGERIVKRIHDRQNANFRALRPIACSHLADRRCGI